MMHRTIVILIVMVVAACNKPVTLESLKKQIEGELSLPEGVFAVAFKDLQTGEELFIHQREVFHAASTMKTPVMIEVYKQAAAGKWSLTDSVEIKNEFSSIVDGSPFSLTVDDDSEEVLYSKVGQKATLYELIYDMIIVSSNLATNIVIELADAKKVTQTMRDLGAVDIQVLRGVEDLKAFDQGLNNTTTAYDLMIIFEQLAQGNIVSPEASDEMIKILLDQKFKEIIPAELPKGVTVAHKTGSITGVRHDSGIVFLPDGRKYVLVLLSKQMTDPEAGISSMANVSKMIYDYVTQN
jgi:beta-lactamase class A